MINQHTWVTQWEKQPSQSCCNCRLKSLKLDPKAPTAEVDEEKPGWGVVPSSLGKQIPLGKSGRNQAGTRRGPGRNQAGTRREPGGEQTDSVGQRRLRFFIGDAHPPPSAGCWPHTAPSCWEQRRKKERERQKGGGWIVSSFHPSSPLRYEGKRRVQKRVVSVQHSPEPSRLSS